MFTPWGLKIWSSRQMLAPLCGTFSAEYSVANQEWDLSDDLKT